MKNLFGSIIALLFVLSLSAQVPQQVNSAFSARYQHITPSWNEDNGNYVAQFTDVTGHACTVVFDPTGNFVSSQQTLDRSELSTEVETEISNRFLGNGSSYTYHTAALVENQDGNFETVTLSTGNGNLRIYFNASGQMVKRELF